MVTLGRRTCVLILVFCFTVVCVDFCHAQVSYWRALIDTAGELSAQKQYKEAVPVAEEALATAKTTFGPMHAKTLETYDLLLSIYQNAGVTEKAEHTQNLLNALRHNVAAKKLKETETKYGSKSPAVADALGDMAKNYSDRSKPEIAEGLYLEAVRVTEKAKGKNHPAVADKLDQLAFFYRDQKLWEKVEAPLVRALAIRKTAYGPYDIRTIEAQLRVGDYYMGRQRYDVAEELLADADGALLIAGNGAKDPRRIPVLINLAQAQHFQNKLKESRTNYETALGIMVEFYDGENPAMLDVLIPLAAVQIEQEQWEAALATANRSIAIHEKFLPENSPSAIGPLEQAARAEMELAKYDSAENHLARSLKIRESVSGEKSDEALDAVMALADTRYQADDPDQTKAYYDQAIKILSEKHGAMSAEVGAAHFTMGDIYQGKERFAEAIEEYQLALIIYESSTGEAGEPAGRCRYRIGQCKYALGEYDDALSMWMSADAIQEETLEAGDPQIVATLGGIADIYHTREEFKKAETYYKRALEQVEVKNDGPSYEKAQLLNSLGELYMNQEKITPAREYYHKALASLNKETKQDQVLAKIIKSNLETLDTLTGK